MKSLHFFFTTDVDWIPGSQEGLEQLMDFSEYHSLQLSLFITGKFAIEYPQLVNMAAKRGFELGTHGWEHGVVLEDFSSASFDQQRTWLRLSSDAVESASGMRPVLFRAPDLSFNPTLFKALESEKYLYDSSMPSLRCFPQLTRHRYFLAPTTPYHPSHNNPSKKGESSIWEFPPASFFIPINMSALRVFGFKPIALAIHCLRKISNTLVFYSHPAEFVIPSKLTFNTPNPKRHTQGIGPHNYELLGQLIRYIKSLGYRSIFFKDAF